jgi:hypothetical protein
MRRTDEKYLAGLITRYSKASKKERSVILDEFVKTTGYHRKYAIAVLSGKRKRAKGPIRRPRRTLYGDEEARALLALWDLFDGIYSKRLRAAMDVELPRLYANGHIQMSPKCYHKLLQISPATMDRLLRGRRPQVGKSRGFTKPGTLLKDRIPIRTWADWNEDQPGFCEMDLVDHSGGRIIPRRRSCLDSVLHRHQNRLDRMRSGAQQGSSARLCCHPNCPSAFAVLVTGYRFR